MLGNVAEQPLQKCNKIRRKCRMGSKLVLFFTSPALPVVVSLKNA